MPTVPVVIGDDLGPAPRRCAPTRRCTSAAWAAGSRTSTTRWPAAWATPTPPPRCREKYLAKDIPGAMAAVPFEFIDRTSLIGPAERIRDRLAAYADAGVTTLTVATYAATLAERVMTLRTMADVVEEAGLA